MTIESLIAEGFKIKVVKDLGWPWTSDKAMFECRFCHSGAVLGPLSTGRETDPNEPIIVPVHDFCFDEAKRKWETS